MRRETYYFILLFLFLGSIDFKKKGIKRQRREEMTVGLIEAASGWSLTAIIIRMVSALLIGTIIGVDRGMKRRGAGIKTHTLVCLGSALVMLTGQYIYIHFDAKNDIARLGAQVISGVGFLGVGTIIVTGKNQVKGLTTAAGLWACACLGLAVGIGFVEGAVVTLILVMITLKVLARIDKVLQSYSKVCDYYVEFNGESGVGQFIDEIHLLQLKIVSFEMGKDKIPGEGPYALVTIIIKERAQRENMLDTIRKMEGIRFVEEI